MSRVTQSIRVGCILFLALFSGTAAAEQIYKSVDAEGNVTFSNEPPADAVEVDEVKVQPGPSAEAQKAARERMQAQEATASELGEARASRTPPPAAASQDAPAVVEPVERVNQYYGSPNRKPVRPDRPVQLPARPVQLPARPVPR